MCEASYFYCVESGIFRSLPRVFAMRLCVYVCTEASTGRERGRERKHRRKKESQMGEMNGFQRRPCWTSLSPLSPLFRGELQVCIPNEHIGWRTALHNQQTLTPKEPKGPPAAMGGRAEQTQCHLLLQQHVRKVWDGLRAGGADGEEERNNKAD